MPADRLRQLPAVETVLGHAVLKEALAALPRPVVLEAVRHVIAEERARLKDGSHKPASTPEIARRAASAATAAALPALVPVINGTGVVLHTNLGRAPLARAAADAVARVASGYASLEFDLATGRRGARGVGVEAWLKRLTGAEAATVVNNGAGAILVALSALAAGRRVLVSRGELVEIGGSFRVPEVMEKSGAVLAEVGATNRTHLRDYERAFEKMRDVGAILRVHRSNFRIEGFTSRPELRELATLAKKRRVPLIEDLGSGALVELGMLGLEREPTVAESLRAGCAVVTFSGDKLLGASQAGFVLGGARWMRRVRKDPLARALRLDKLALAALEATLPLYAEPERALREVPALAMLGASREVLDARAKQLAKALGRIPGVDARIAEGSGEVGGGALPLTRLPGPVVEVTHRGVTAETLKNLARSAQPPVIGTIVSGAFRLNPRTMSDAEVDLAAAALAEAIAQADDRRAPGKNTD